MKRNKVKSVITTLTIIAVLSACGQNSEPADSPDTVDNQEKTSAESVVHEETSREETLIEENSHAETLYDQVNGKLYVGDEFTLGTYEQDNDLSNGAEDIEWIVLEKVNDNEYLCISKYVLDAQTFGKDGLEIRIRWSTSQLREWLNNDFYNTAFTDSDAGNLVKMSTKYATWQSINDNDIYWDTAEDMVRVLNYGELDSFPGCVKITDYAKAQGAPYFDDGTREHENCSDGWYMMSYDVDRVREYMEHFTEPDDGSYTMVTGSRGTNLSIAVYDHSRIVLSHTYDEYGTITHNFDEYKEGVRPVIRVKLTEQ